MVPDLLPSTGGRSRRGRRVTTTDADAGTDDGATSAASAGTRSPAAVDDERPAGPADAGAAAVGSPDADATRLTLGRLYAAYVVGLGVGLVGGPFALVAAGVGPFAAFRTTLLAVGAGYLLALVPIVAGGRGG
jgi:hypothetical protein